MKSFLIFLVLLVVLASNSFAQSKAIFSGIPIVKISEGGIERFPEKISKKEAANLGCIISKIGGKYYWASRENKQMFRELSGAFIIFFAVDGAGYVKIILPEMKKILLEEFKRSPRLKEIPGLELSETEEKFDYVEHLSFGLKSVTYYGKVVVFDHSGSN
jgi:YHS domain-containing protein